MAKRKDTTATAPSGDAAVGIKVAAEGSIAPSEVKAEAPATEFKAEPPAAELPLAELPKVEAPKLAEPPVAPTVAPSAQAACPADAAIPPIVAPMPVANANVRSRYALLAASCMIAVGIGAIGGALAATAFMISAPAPTANADVTAAIIAQLRTDLSALRTSVEGGAKATNAQLAKMTERFERYERAQSEPLAKISKAVEALDRLEKRAEFTSGRDTTGSVTQPIAVTPASASQPQTVDGWVVRDVYRGTAIIQGRRFGMLEVEAGDTVPGVGRVEAIRKQDGRWIVVTSKGVIGSPQPSPR
jgi:hypothetical protein